MINIAGADESDPIGVPFDRPRMSEKGRKKRGRESEAVQKPC
jgi:hypothetical protein